MLTKRNTFILNHCIERNDPNIGQSNQNVAEDQGDSR